MTVSELIHGSFRLIGAIASGEALETAELNDAFGTLNQLVRSWNTEGLSLPSRTRMSQSVGSTNTYLLPVRPLRIESASVQSGGIDSQLEIVDSAGWERVPEKQATSVYVRVLFCDYGYPNATVYIAPIPRLGGLLEMWAYTPLAPFANTGATIDLTDGYEMALRYNLAMALLPEYPRSQVDPTLPAQAQMYKGAIAQLNAANHMHVPPAAAVPAPAAA